MTGYGEPNKSAQLWTDEVKSARKVLGFKCSSPWAAKLWPARASPFPNELISRDEGLHAEFACLVVRLPGGTA